MDKSCQASTDPGTQREGALERFGELNIQTGGKPIPQYESKYFSQILPFVMPYMCSGPDFFPNRRWRRLFSDAPIVTPQAFLANFGRLVQAQCRSDWSALPIMRNVVFRWTAEHTMSQVTSIVGKRGSAANTEVSSLIQAAQNLYKKLHEGFVGSGVHRVPVAGDTTKLPFAAGLSPLEKKMAWAQHFLAKQMAGTQQLRQLMGHNQFGARICYGDCLFITISPNEQHSALVLRLSRYRQNDPYIRHAKSKRRRLLWVTAFDKIKANNLNLSKEKEEMRKERWLEFHDRYTNGIPGLLPLVADLPIRFTEAIDKKSREQGVFKHTRGILRTWQLHEDELSRINALDDPEVVLYQRPVKLFIEVPSATKLMPTINGRKMYTLSVQVRPWSLDKAGAIKIARYGFPIVPDFGGTAHAYCGSTLDAALGDFLHWSSKPSLPAMLKAYIIRSRVKEVSDIIIAQPYNPHLFQQGILPGPQLLLDVLLRKITTLEAQP